jgi:hypothetical protein
MRERTGRIARSLAFGSLLLLAAPAAAADATAIADELVAMLTGGTRVAVYETATAVGEVVTITGFAFDDPPTARAAVAGSWSQSGAARRRYRRNDPHQRRIDRRRERPPLRRSNSRRHLAARRRRRTIPSYR